MPCLVFRNLCGRKHIAFHHVAVRVLPDGVEVGAITKTHASIAPDRLKAMFSRDNHAPVLGNGVRNAAKQHWCWHFAPGKKRSKVEFWCSHAQQDDVRK